MKIHSSVKISAIGEKIWPLLVEPVNIIKWCPIELIKYTSNKHGGLDTTFYFEEKTGGQLLKMDFTVTEWNENRSVAYKLTKGNWVKNYQQRYVIEDTPTGSQLTCYEYVRLRFGVIGDLVDMFLKKSSRNRLHGMMAKMKVLAEA